MLEFAFFVCLCVCRSSTGLSEALSPETENGDRNSVANEEYKESTTLQIRTAEQRPHKEVQIIGSTMATLQREQQGDMEAFSKTKQETYCHKIPPKVIEAPTAHLIEVPAFAAGTGARPGPAVELQLSLSHDRHKDPNAPGLTILRAEKSKSTETGSSQPGDGTSWVTSAPAIEKNYPDQWSSPTFQIVSGKETKATPGAQTKEPSLTKVEVILDCSDREKEVSRSLSEKGCVDSPVEGGQSEAPPSIVSFGISSEGTEPGEEDQQSEREPSRPHKHRARHASKYVIAKSVVIPAGFMLC